MISVMHGAAQGQSNGYWQPLPGAANRFGRMFPQLPPWAGLPGGVDATIEALRQLAAVMQDGDPFDTAGDIAAVPAGYTYLGQFIDHDVTFDPSPLPNLRVEPTAVSSFRTPALELDSVYGAGPDATPMLYERAASGAPRVKLKLGETAGNVSKNDLPRQGLDAVIGDPRNDENLVVAQTHVAFLKFHNAIVDRLATAGVPPERQYAEARRLATWHYQWIVMHDFLPRIADPETVSDVRQNGSRHFRPSGAVFVPVEFAVAAYRMGHSMVRQTYDFNDAFPEASLAQLFEFSGLADPAKVPVPEVWVINWRRFYDIDGSGAAANRARQIDPFLAPDLHAQIPEGGLAFRNLVRGFHLGLPTGQAVAMAMGQTPLSSAQIASGIDGEVAAQHGLHEQTPLWYYILKEAEQLGGLNEAEGGQHLGPVGARIVVEVFAGFLACDPRSYVNQAPAWRPTELPAETAGTFTMADLLRFIGL